MKKVLVAAIILDLILMISGCNNCECVTNHPPVPTATPFGTITLTPTPTIIFTPTVTPTP